MPVSGWVRTRGCTVGGFVVSRWALTISGLPVAIRALLIQRILGLRAGDLAFQIVRKRFIGRTGIADRCRATFVRHGDRIQHRELGGQFLVGVVGVPSGIGADLCRLTLAVQVTIVEDADQRKSVYQIAPVLVFHQLAEQFSSGLQLAWGEVLLPARGS